MSWSSFHRGDFNRLRRGLTMALLEIEVLEAQAQLAYASEIVSADFAADVSLLRLLLERADKVTRHALDIELADGNHFDVYSDRKLAGVKERESLRESA